MKTSLMSGVDPHVTLKDWSWEEFCVAVRSQSRTRLDESEDEKKRATSFACCEFQPLSRRLDNLVEASTWAVVLDLDSILEKDKVVDSLSGWRYIAWTTWNSRPGAEKWRVVIPLEKAVDRLALNRIVAGFSGVLRGLAKVDVASRDAAHLWFFPWHRQSMRRHHRIWENEGSLYSGGNITVDFSDTPSTRPEKVSKGGRNAALHRFLGERTGLECETLADLVNLAEDWNSKLGEPLPRREVRDVARKKWRWMTNDPHGLAQRARALRVGDKVEEGELDPWVLGKRTVAAKAMPMIGDIIYPGCTLLTAKLKEGKSFLAAQLAFAMASGDTFLNGADFPGFTVRSPGKSIIVAGEDTEGTIATRLLGNVKSGHLPDVEVGVYFQKRLIDFRERHPRLTGCQRLETMVEAWYRSGVRMIILDPLRVVEASLGVVDYPGVVREMNAHTREFLGIVYYNKLAERYRDLSIVLSLHHGKSKRDHNASDPADMIAGTSGILAGAMTTISLLPTREVAEWDDGPKRRELYIHGRMTREHRLLVEQDERTGLWRCLGDVKKLSMSSIRETYMEALMDLGAVERWVPGDEVARRVGRRIDTIHAVLRRMIAGRAQWNGKAIIAQRARGYRLVAT